MFHHAHTYIHVCELCICFPMYMCAGYSPSARKFITSQTFWEGEFKLEGSPVDIDPEAVKWLQVLYIVHATYSILPI